MLIIIQKKNPIFVTLLTLRLKHDFFNNLYNLACRNTWSHESFLMDFILYSIGMSQGNIANSKEYQNVEETTLNIWYSQY